MGRGVAVLLVLVLSAFFVAVARPAALSAPPTENTWTTKAPMPGYLCGCKAAVVNGKIYVVGSSANYMYDTLTENWTVKTPMPTPRMYFGIAVYKNKIYAIGGRNGESTFSINEVYDPSTDTWETKQPMPTSRYGLEANIIDGKIYLLGGINKDSRVNTVFAVNEVYDVATDLWTTEASMPYPVWGYASAAANDKIYVFGGLGPVF
jgi:N-acetylneuraminic acid mutarotase